MTTVSGIFQEYLERKSLAEIGYRFDPKDLTPTKIEFFTAFENEIARGLSEKAPRGAKRGRR